MATWQAFCRDTSSGFKRPARPESGRADRHGREGLGLVERDLVRAEFRGILVVVIVIDL
jgi:hypothetical protein